MEAQPFVAQKILDKIRALSQEILHILPPKSTLIKNNVTNIGWKPPPPSFFKLNTDGSARGNPGMASVGGLLRDPRGAWVGSFSRAICFTNSMAAELWGLRDGLVLAKNLNIRKLLIEIDAQTVINVLKLHSIHLNSTGPYSGLITDCRLLLQHFEKARIDHIHCEGNHCVNLLAKEGINNPNSLVLHSVPLPYILYKLLADAWGVVYPRPCSS